MTDRRRHRRFSVSDAWEGQLEFLEDVIVEHSGAGELTVLAVSPACRGEELVIDLTGSGPSVALEVRVVESRPVSVDGVIRHQLRLVPVEASAPAVIEPPQQGAPATAVVAASPPGENPV